MPIKAVILCMTALTYGVGGSPVLGSVKEKCVRCNQDVFVSVATLKSAKEQVGDNYELCCIPCMKEEETINAEFVKPTKEQIREIVLAQIMQKRNN
jgi:hypothetical protein